MTDTDFLPDLIEEIMQQGYDRKTASRYAVIIGDTPVSDGHGNLLVLDQNNRELARFPMPALFIVD